MALIEIEQYHRPVACQKCGGTMIFKGVGEYQCEKCQALEYDDYGKVRLYIEKHRGATAAEIEEAVGVKQRTIRQMLKEEKLEVTQDSLAFLKCEICGVNIRSGRYCPKCEAAHNHDMNDKQRAERIQKMQGFGAGLNKLDEGEKRFKRER